MKHSEMAARLNGREYRKEITDDEEDLCERYNLCVVFGASDDLVEFRGAIYDEVGAYNGTTVKLCGDGVLPSKDSIDRDDDDAMEEYLALKKKCKHTIKAVFDPGNGMTWAYETKIPHSTFDVMEDGEVYCRGIVFNVDALEE